MGDWLLVLVAAVPTLLTAVGWALRRLATIGDEKVALVQKEAEAEKKQAERLAAELKEAHAELADEKLRAMFREQKLEALQEDVNQLRAMASLGKGLDVKQEGPGQEEGAR